MKLSMKKLEILKKNIKFKGGLLELKAFLKLLLLREMDHDSAHMVVASKVPMLKPGVETIIAPATAEEKAQR
nr:hypothetical protein [Tanacetum cinerariifolium]